MTELGSSPDRVIINVQVEEQSTGEFSIGSGHSTADGLLAEVSIGERNLLGYGLYAKASVQYGQSSSGYSLSFVEPYLLGYRLSLEVDLFSRVQKATDYVSYETPPAVAAWRLGFALREDLSLQLRYSIYSQKIDIDQSYRNRNNVNPNSTNGLYPTSVTGIDPNTGSAWIDPATGQALSQNCYEDGEASLAVRKELAQGAVSMSLVGYDLTYNTLDNNCNPTSGMLAILKQDFAGVDGDVQYIRTTADVRSYYEPIQDVVGVLRLQAGYIHGWGSDGLRMLDHFQMGPNLERGFAPSGIGPRDTTGATARLAARTVDAFTTAAQAAAGRLCQIWMTWSDVVTMPNPRSVLVSVIWCASSEWAAMQSSTMIVQKSRWNASRAAFSTHTFVAIPVNSSASMPCARRMSSRSVPMKAL
jgi:outer membrane protein insertion porin family